MKALGTMLPGNGAWRSAQCQRVVHSAPQAPSKNAGHRTQHSTLEAWYGSAEASLRRPPAHCLPVRLGARGDSAVQRSLDGQPLGKELLTSKNQQPLHQHAAPEARQG